MARVRIAAAAAVAVLVATIAACQKKAEKAPAPEGQAAAPAAAPAAVARPKRKPGLWEQKVSFGQMTQTTRFCLDEATDEKMDWSQRSSEVPCSQHEVHARPGGGWEFSSVCDMAEAGHVASHGVATGDFASHYRVDMESTTTGAPAPQMNGAHKLSIEADWKGPCPADMKPGEISLPNGLKINPTGTGSRPAG